MGDSPPLEGIGSIKNKEECREAEQRNLCIQNPVIERANE